MVMKLRYEENKRILITNLSQTCLMRYLKFLG